MSEYSIYVFRKLNTMLLLIDKTELANNLTSHMKDPEFNDVKIEASDGVVPANKTILSMQSEYFKRMFSANFVESSTGIVKLPYPKVVIETVVFYLYSGEMDCDDMSLRCKGKISVFLQIMSWHCHTT